MCVCVKGPSVLLCASIGCFCALCALRVHVVCDHPFAHARATLCVCVCAWGSTVNPASGWQAVPIGAGNPQPSPRGSHAVEELNGALYLFGACRLRAHIHQLWLCGRLYLCTGLAPV